MSPLKLLVIAALAFAAPAYAQNTKQQGASNNPRTTDGSRTAVGTQPSSNPFQNPIGQGVAPAASANSSQNSNRTNVTR